MYQIHPHFANEYILNHFSCMQIKVAIAARKGARGGTQKQLGALVSLYHFVSLARHVTKVLGTISKTDAGEVGVGQKRQKTQGSQSAVGGGRNLKRSRHFGKQKNGDDDADGDVSDCEDETAFFLPCRRYT
jgi:hypothetical protein